jgi:hypothetical protein
LAEGLATPLGESSAGSFAFFDVRYEKSENGFPRASYGVGKAKEHPSPLLDFIAEEVGVGRASVADRRSPTRPFFRPRRLDDELMLCPGKKQDHAATSDITWPRQRRQRPTRDR